MIQVQGPRIDVETRTLTAVIDRGLLTSLKSKRTGEECLRPYDVESTPAVQLLYSGGEAVALDRARFSRVECYSLSDHRAEVIVHAWDGEAVLTVAEEAESGDLIITPAAYSSRPGVQGCRWNLPGVRKDLELVAPLFQGVKLKLDDPLVHGKGWRWPHAWEAGLAILQGARSGMWVHTQDTDCRFKSLRAGTAEGPHGLALESQANGPTDANLSAGGLSWRLNVYEGDWQVPAGQYRDWLWRTRNLEPVAQARPEWMHQLTLALSWCPGEPALLDALASRVDPHKVLLHFPNWRTDGYDENYPDYFASDSAKVFLAKGQAMGFHIMPHFNSIDMDPIHPVYNAVRDFVYRDPETKRLQGWSWFEGHADGVPESNLGRYEHRDKKVMVKIHPGLSMWRSILGRRLLAAAQDLSLDTVFIDVTLCTWNIANCLVEGMTPVEGMRELIAHVGRLGQGLQVGGEGLNETTAEGLSFAQAHLFESWHDTAEGLERAGGCALNQFLFGRLCRTIGYSGLSGKTEKERIRMQVHDQLGAIPTLTVHSPEEITKPNAAVEAVLAKAGG